MRRLIEILLILSYRHHSIETQIEDPTGGFKSLSKIIGDAKTNKTLGLSKPTKECIDEFRILGNFSAHRIEYNCKRGDIEKIRLDYRATVEELLYKAGIKK